MDVSNEEAPPLPPWKHSVKKSSHGKLDNRFVDRDGYLTIRPNNMENGTASVADVHEDELSNQKRVVDSHALYDHPRISDSAK